MDDDISEDSHGEEVIWKELFIGIPEHPTATSTHTEHFLYFHHMDLSRIYLYYNELDDSDYLFSSFWVDISYPSICVVFCGYDPHDCPILNPQFFHKDEAEMSSFEKAEAIADRKFTTWKCTYISGGDMSTQVITMKQASSKGWYAIYLAFPPDAPKEQTSRGELFVLGAEFEVTLKVSVFDLKMVNSIWLLKFYLILKRDFLLKFL